MMKIIVLSSGLNAQYGGSAISEASLCAALKPHGEVGVLCRKERLDTTFTAKFGLQGVQPFSPWEVFDAFGNPSHWLHDFLLGADIFHLNGHWRPENYFFTRLCRRKGIPYVMHPRGMFLLGHRKVALKKLFNLVLGNEMARYAARVIALSRFEVQQFSAYPISPDRINVVPNGIPFPPEQKAPRASEGEPYFLYIGRLEARKNLLFLIEAFANYVRSGGKHKLRLVGPVERGYDNEILAKIRSLKLTQSAMIQAPAYDEKKWQLISGAKAVVYPTVDEPYGRVPFEAVAAATFPIVPDESGSAEYLSRFLPFCIYRHQHHGSLVETLRRLENPTDGQRADLAKARAWVAEALDWKRIALQVVTIYRECGMKKPYGEDGTLSELRKTGALGR